MTQPHMIMRLVCLASGNDTPFDGQYVVESDVNALDGRGALFTTPDPEKAKLFDSLAELTEYWQRQSTIQPTRSDGKPNRPLTAWNIEVKRV